MELRLAQAMNWRQRKRVQIYLYTTLPQKGYRSCYPEG